MSHAVRIDYQGISIQCQSICEMASSQLCKLDKMLDEIEKESARLLNSQTEALRKEIFKTKQKLQSKIDSVLQQARRNAGQGAPPRRKDPVYGRDRHTGHACAGEGIRNRLDEQNEKLKDLASGRVRINVAVQQKINEIDDEIIKQYVYLAWIDHPNENFERIYSIAMAAKEKADNQQYEKVKNQKIEEIKTDLRAEKIDEATIEKIVATSETGAKESIKEVRERANAEIVGEKVRKESVKIIVKAIKSRGFVVDSRSIKIDRANNQVIIVAMKPSGAKAEFKVFLDGKFEYRFDGYEGQACQKDIQPFMQDLEEVYGMKITNRTELWAGNPDKNSTMKYQTVDYNKNRR